MSCDSEASTWFPARWARMSRPPASISSGSRPVRACESGRQPSSKVTGLRNPCTQLETIQPGLMKAVLDRDADGNLLRKAGVMGIVIEGGDVRAGDPIVVDLPSRPHRPLEPV